MYVFVWTDPENVCTCKRVNVYGVRATYINEVDTFTFILT